MSKTFSFTATGDSFISRRLPAVLYEGFQSIEDLIKSGEFRFTNFEMITPDNNRTPSAVSGGTWANANPDVIKDIQRFGFNSVTWANNHTLDFLYDGLISTKYYLERENLIHAGVGMHLSEASEPKYLEMKEGRVGLIGITTTFHETWKAGEQRKDGPGRPGVNGVSWKNIYGISEEEMNVLKNIGEKTGINAKRNLDILEGFIDESSNKYVFGSDEFEVSEEYCKKTIMNPSDMNRIILSIQEAKERADYVIVSVHSHEMAGEDKDAPSQFMEDMSHTFIEQGADVIIGHGPHVIRGVEIYKGKPIFYSLGNFIFQNDTINYLPADFYNNYDLPLTSGVGEALSTRSRGDTRGLGINKKVWQSVIASWDFKDNQLSNLKLHPISLQGNKKSYNRGWPVKTENVEVLLRMKELSKPYGTEVIIENGLGKIELN